MEEQYPPPPIEAQVLNAYRKPLPLEAVGRVLRFYLDPSRMIFFDFLHKSHQNGGGALVVDRRLRRRESRFYLDCLGGLPPNNASFQICKSTPTLFCCCDFFPRESSCLDNCTHVLRSCLLLSPFLCLAVIHPEFYQQQNLHSSSNSNLANIIFFVTGESLNRPKAITEPDSQCTTLPSLHPMLLTTSHRTRGASAPPWQCIHSLPAPLLCNISLCVFPLPHPIQRTALQG